MTAAWTMTDLVTTATYTFKRNPSAMVPPFNPKQLETLPRYWSTRTRKASTTPREWTFTGTTVGQPMRIAATQFPEIAPLQRNVEGLERMEYEEMNKQIDALVGRLGAYWAAEDGQRVEKGLTFKASPEWPFVKDRLTVTPEWTTVTFAESDYPQLFERLAERLRADDLGTAEVLGDIPDAGDERPAGALGALSGGPIRRTAKPEVPAKERTLADCSEEELVAKGRELGHDPKGNTLKVELITLIESGAARADRSSAARGDAR